MVNKKVKVVVCILLLFTSVNIFAKTHKDGYKWNKTIYDYSDKGTMDLFEAFYGKVDQLEIGLGVTTFYLDRAPLYNKDTKDTAITFYSLAIGFWLDYIKFVFCDADGLQYLSEEQVSQFNEIFPDLCRFANNFFAGNYTNGVDPYDSDFVVGELAQTIDYVSQSLAQMEPRVLDLYYYLENPAAIPQLTVDNKKQSIGFFQCLFMIVVIIGMSIFAIFRFRNKVAFFEKIATIIERLNIKNKAFVAYHFIKNKISSFINKNEETK